MGSGESKPQVHSNYLNSVAESLFPSIEISHNEVDGDESGVGDGQGAGKRSGNCVVNFFAGTEARASLSIFAFVLVVGIALGLVIPPSTSSSYPEPWRAVSNVVGWTYFIAWSVSFYPQVFLNYYRKSVEGLSFEYQALNLVGFSCYTAYNCGYYWNADIRAQYAAANNGSLPTVQLNDVFFSIHAVVLTLIVLIQICIYPKGGQRLSLLVIFIISCMIVLAIVFALLVQFSVGEWFTWLNYLLFLSYIKLSITLMKYTPQAYLNCRRKSTEGWT
jgi:cystinosin